MTPISYTSLDLIAPYAHKPIVEFPTLGLRFPNNKTTKSGNPEGLNIPMVPFPSYTKKSYDPIKERFLAEKNLIPVPKPEKKTLNNVIVKTLGLRYCPKSAKSWVKKKVKFLCKSKLLPIAE